MRNYRFIGVVVALVLAGCSNDRPEVGKAPDLNQARELRDDLFTEASASADVADTDPDLKPQDYQTLTGRFVLAGDAPDNPPLTVDKDIGVCLPGGGRLFDDSLQVNARNKGLRNVLIYVEDISADWVHESARGDASEVVFDQKDCLFLDPIFVAQTSQSLLIKNSDPIGHNTKFEPRGNPAMNLTIPGGQSTQYKPQSAVAQPFEVSCTIHSWMKANMIFRDNGYYAVSDADGNFTIPNVPTGVPLPIKVWHPRGQSLKAVTIEDGSGTSENVALSRGGMKRTFTPGEPVEWQVTINAADFK